MSFVGRDAELEALDREARRVFEAAKGRCVFVEGPAGAGKTALVERFGERLRRARPDTLFASGRCPQSFGAGEPYVPFVEALRSLAAERTALPRQDFLRLITDAAPGWLSVLSVNGAAAGSPAYATNALRQRLAAVWFVDIVGYTGLTSEDEDAAVRMVARFQTLAGDVVGRNGGRVVKFIGDAALAEFPTTRSALDAALELRDRFAAAAGARVRAGIHVGEVLSAPDGDLYGNGVNIAARLQDLAGPGEVLVSDDVWRQLRRRPEFELLDHGEHALKGIADPVRVFAASLGSAGATPVAMPAAATLADPVAGGAVVSSRESLFLQYIELTRAIAARAPLLLLLDDLHWADQTSLALLGHLARAVSAAPVLIIGTLRTDEPGTSDSQLDDLIRELEREGLATRVALGDLRPDAVHALIAAEFEGDISEPLRRWVVGTAGGNPLFASELSRLLRQSGAAVQEHGEWQITRAADTLEVPPSAEAVIENRVRRLDRGSIRVLQYASVLGNEFNSFVLARLLEVTELELLDLLEDIERRHRLVVTVGEAPLPDGDIATVLRYRHALVQTVLYRQVRGKRKVLLHRKAGEVLESLHRDAPEAVAAEIARHFHQGRLPEPAYRFARLAADGARRVYAYWEAEELLRIALEHAPGDAERATIHERLGDVYDIVGYYDRGIAHYEAALKALVTPSGGSLRLRRKLVVLRRKAGLAPAPELLRTVRALIEEAEGHPVERCRLLLELLRFPDAVGAFEATRESVRIAEGLEDPALLAEVLEQLAVALISRGQAEQALPELARALEVAGNEHGPTRAARNANIAGVALAKLGRYRDALHAFERVLELMERVGDLNGIGGACNNIGHMLLRLGELEAAERILLRARLIHTRRDRATLCQSLFNLAERARRAGDSGLAADRYGELVDHACALEYWTSEAVAHAGIGLCRLEAGSVEAASAAAERALAAVADRDGWFEDRELVEILLARLDAERGDVAAADRRLADAARVCRELDVYVWAGIELERARLLADRRPDDARAALARVETAMEGVESSLDRDIREMRARLVNHPRARTEPES